MNWRKWLVRGMVYTFMVAFVVLFIAYQILTNPTATRRKVLDKLNERFLGATVSLESARLNLLDGISISELRMARRDDLDKTDFLYVPSGIIYHDKEHVLDGKLALLKIVLNRPQLRVLIDRNGRCNLLGLLGPVGRDERMPTIVIQEGTIVLEDRRLTAGKPILELRNINLTILNDPLPQLLINGNGQTDVLGALQVHAEAERVGGAFHANLELPAIAIGPGLVQRLAEFFPDVGLHLRQLKASGKMQIGLSWQPAGRPVLGLTVSGEINDGHFNHARLPHPIDQIEARFECLNDPPPAGEKNAAEDGDVGHPSLLNLRFPTIRITGLANSARLEANIRDLVVPRLGKAAALDSGESPTRANNLEPGLSPGLEKCPMGATVPREDQPRPLSTSLVSQFEDELPLRELTYSIEHMAVTPDLFRYLPEPLQALNEDYKPCGPVSITHRYQRPRPGKWEKQYVMQPEGMEAEFIKFPYPLHGITGVIERTHGSDHAQHISLDLAGYGGDRPVTLKGTVDGEKAVAAIQLEITANNVPLDERLLHALPVRQQALAAQFHAEGLADVKAYIKRARGEHDFANQYVVAVHDAALNYDIFPYRLEQVKGVLELLPDHWVCREFRGIHPATAPNSDFHDGDRISTEVITEVVHVPHGGEICLQGRSFPPTLEQTRNGITGAGRVQLLIQGKNVQVNKELEEALAPPNIPARVALQRTWRTMGLGGRMNFDAEVLDVLGQPKDIDVSVNLRGCSMRPKFFEYNLTDLAAKVHYSHDLVDVRDVQARHGASQLAFKQAQVMLRADDGFQARIGDPQPLGRLAPNFVARGMMVDSSFLAALPPALRKGLGALQLEGSVDLQTALVIDQKDPNKAPVIWWDGGVALPGNTILAGVPVRDIQGGIATCGRFDGQQLEGMVGNLLLDKASVLGQPVNNLKAQIQVSPDSPQTLRLRNLSAQFFGGQVGVEARVEFAPKLAYDMVAYGTGIQLEQFGRHNMGSTSEIQGPTMVALHLSGNGAEIVDLKGNGQIDVPSGKLYHLPLIVDMLKAIVGRSLDGTAFEQVHTTFAIENGKLQFSELELLGNAVNLRGQGSVNLDGSHINLDFNVDLGWMRVFPAAVTFIPHAISDQLFKIKMRGRVGDVHFEKVPLPNVVEPIKKVFGKSS
jgi:AsmA-like C-terminal region